MAKEENGGEPTGGEGTLVTPPEDPKPKRQRRKKAEQPAQATPELPNVREYVVLRQEGDDPTLWREVAVVKASTRSAATQEAARRPTLPDASPLEGVLGGTYRAIPVNDYGESEIVEAQLELRVTARRGSGPAVGLTAPSAATV